ncbi:MAG: DUF2911 domain-containing protein [Cytophagales bacterium]
MKRSILVISLLVMSALAFVFADQLQQSPKAIAEGSNVKVKYGQPSKKGRVIFGELVPFGQVWRSGANEATEITFSKDALVAGKDVKAGTYSLFTIPHKDKWTVILNSKLGQWGSFEYENIKANDVLKTDVNVIALKDVVEKLDYSIDSKGLTIAWDATSVFVPIAIK